MYTLQHLCGKLWKYKPPHLQRLLVGQSARSIMPIKSCKSRKWQVGNITINKKQITN